mmetsp:Transcript_1228/g.2848  ORF Transcript_1228/g.2848 Transcript_1228/m.2848 type:complete len:262 (+) Transcript_1228:316-1101(+)
MSGEVMSSGRIQASNCAAVSRPSSTPASFSVVLSLYAFLAMAAAASYPMCGLSAVTSMSEDRMSWSMRSRLGSMPRTQFSAKDTDASDSRRMLCRLLWAIRGLATFSSKWDPAAPPRVTPMSLPTTWAHTIIMASHCVGFTLPGMMLLPGSLAGRLSSPSPARGPLPSIRMSLEILSRLSAMVLSMPERAVCASCAASASNLLGAETKGSPVSTEISRAMRSAYSGCVLRPVPTAVPPMASSVRCTMDALARMSELRICCA